MKEAGIALDEPVNIFISGVTLRDGLDLMLLPFGLDYVAEHGVVHVTTKVVADQKLKIEIHTNLTSPQENPEELIELITTLVEPDSWAQLGGRGVIRPYKNGLIILQTQRTHHKISQFLTALKEAE
ncbi:hypothetical protein [uncultured Rubinisphaera sp.]|uniref:hypothetical protein n=1 Tax=uncultured Rubinisphaera sp. TaxID=1678686 RepID=UPI0030DAAB3D